MSNVIPRKSDGNAVEFDDKVAIWVNRAAALVSKDTKPATPTDFAGSSKEYAVLLSWTPVAQADFYNLYVSSTNDVNAKQSLGRLNGEVSSFLHYLGSATTRYYWLEAGTNTGRVGELVQASGTSTGLTGAVPAGHATSHEDGGSDEIDVTGLSGLLDDPQIPLAHHAEHEEGGGDEIKLDDLATPDDNTDLDATDTRHGLLPKLSGDPDEFLNGEGDWATPAGGGGGGSEFIDDALVVGYKFDDGSGTTLSDYGPNNLDGTLTNGPTWISPRGITFDGSNDKVVVGAHASLRLKSALSMEVAFRWISGNGGLMDKTGAGTTNENFQIFCEGSIVYFRVVKSNTLTDITGPTMTSNGDYHVVGTWDGREMRLYFDGHLITGRTLVAADIDDIDGDLLIGHLGSNIYPFNGNIYKAAIYDRELTPAEVRQVFEATLER